MREVWVDPGIGFGKTAAHNLALLRHLPELAADPSPVVVGASRKRFLGHVAPGADGAPAGPDERRPASLAAATWAMLAGASMVRAHDMPRRCRPPPWWGTRAAVPAALGLGGRE